MKLVNSILIFVGGVAVGAIPTYIITKRIERKRADEEIAAYKDYVDKKIADLEAKLEKANIDDTEEESKVSEGLVNPEKPSIEELSKRVDAAVENYERVKKNIEWQGHMSVEEAEETGDPELIEQAEWLARKDEMEKNNHFKGQDGSPEVIDQLTYTGEGDGEYTYKDTYSHVSLDYYAKDDILVYGHNCEIDGEEHELNELVEKPGFTVGWKWKQHFGDKELHNDDDCVYVRNEWLCCDFEIVRDAGSYKEIVLGVYDEEEGTGEEE